MQHFIEGTSGRAVTAERKLWHHLKDRRVRGLRFRRQLAITVVDAGRAPRSCIADFACDDAPVVVELTGGRHDLKPASAAVPHGLLEARGYRVLRFDVDAVLTRFGAVSAVIDAACAGYRAVVPLGSPAERRVLLRRRAAPAVGTAPASD